MKLFCCLEQFLYLDFIFFNPLLIHFTFINFIVFDSHRHNPWVKINSHDKIISKTLQTFQHKTTNYWTWHKNKVNVQNLMVLVANIHSSSLFLFCYYIQMLWQHTTRTQTLKPLKKKTNIFSFSHKLQTQKMSSSMSRSLSNNIKSSKHAIPSLA